MKIEKNLKIIKLIDVYGELLTNNQLITLKDYYFNNFSLAEIAENNNISRQAVMYCIKQAVANLQNFEQKLKIIEKNDFILSKLSQMENINIIEEIINKIQE